MGICDEEKKQRLLRSLSILLDALNA